MTEYNYAELVKYLRTTNETICEVSVRNFVKIVCELAQSEAYQDFKNLVDVWVSANKLHRPDLEPEIAEKRSLRNLALMTVTADHGETLEVLINRLNYFNKKELGPAMKFFEKYLCDRELSRLILEDLN
jgi:hypothetical protein